MDLHEQDFTRPFTYSFKGGHTLRYEPAHFYLVDQSGDEAEIGFAQGDERPVVELTKGGIFLIPTMDGNTTPATAEEAFAVMEMLGFPLKVGERNWIVSPDAMSGMGDLAALLGDAFGGGAVPE